MAEEKHTSPGSEGERKYESSDVRLRPLVVSAVVLAVAVVIVVALMAGMFEFFAREGGETDAPPPTAVAVRQVPSEPRLQPDASKELALAYAYEESLLTSTAWVDRDSSLVRIPVERAMDVLAKRGLPARGEAGTAK
jgi:hypothetical protein